MRPRSLPSPACLLLAAGALACAAPHPAAPTATTVAPPATAATEACIPPAARAAFERFRHEQRDRAEKAIERARGFLDGLAVDPIALRAHGIKGKKKLVEALDAYTTLHRIAKDEARPAIIARVTELARPTNDDRYHDMLTVDDRTFKEDATSYLRAAVLLDQLGIDTRRYRAEIAAMKGRLDQHMRERGPHQRRAFHGYYQHFGLAEPFPLEGALAEGFIASSADPEKLARLDVYALTHEIYAAYDFGDHLDRTPFTPAERVYLRGALPRLATLWRAKNDLDLLAEIATCMRYVRMTDDPAFAGAVSALLDGQNPDGSWGSYEVARARLGDLVKQGFYLHTTMVAIEAISYAFFEATPPPGAPVCPG